VGLFFSDPHIQAETLRAFALGTLADEESHWITDHLAFCVSCRQAFVEAMKATDLSSGQGSGDSYPAVPGYRILERIASGGMGIVYLAEETASGAKVAIKQVLPRNGGAGSDRKQRLLRESHALLKLDHPQIARALHLILVDNAPTLVMEYVPGQTLDRWIREEDPGIRLIATAMRSLADAVSHAHQNGVIHCDLKPSNVLVGGDSPFWRFKLIDFGLSKFRDADWSLTVTGDLVGTPAYMAPEQTTGDLVQATESIDVYGLGTILYELLTHRPPFEAASASQLLSKVTRERPRRPRKIRADVPIALDRICMKCLEKNPKDRYSSARALEQDLDSFLCSKPIAAREPTLARKVTRLVQSNRLSAVVLMGAGIASIAASLWYLQESRIKHQLLTSIDRSMSKQEQAVSRASQAEEALLEELRTNLEETTTRLFGSPPDKEDEAWETLDRLAQRWYRFADRMQNSETSRLIRAEALMRIGSVQTVLGNLESAEENLRSALNALPELQESSTNPSQRLTIESETHWQLAKCLFDIGNASESEAAFQKALACIDRAIEKQPHQVVSCLLKSKILCDYGIVLTRLSRLEDASESLNRSISDMEEMELNSKSVDAEGANPTLRPRILQQLWISKTLLARVLLMGGSAEQASQILADSSSQLSALEAQLPDDPTVLHLISVQRNVIGLCQMNLGRFEESKNSATEAKTYHKKLLELYPRRQDILKNYGALCGTLAIISIRLKQPDEALQSIKESYQIHSDLVESYPKHSDYLNEKAKSLSNLVAILASANRFDEASSYGSELMALQRQLRRDYPEQTEYAYNFAASSTVVATVLGRVGQESQAYDLFEQGQATYSDLITTFPSIASYRVGQLNSFYSDADLAIRNRKWKKSLDSYSQILTAAQKAEALSPMDRASWLAKAFLGQALAFKELGSLAESRTQAKLGVDAIAPWKDQSQQAGELFQKCSDLLGEGG